MPALTDRYWCGRNMPQSLPARLRKASAFKFIALRRGNLPDARSHATTPRERPAMIATKAPAMPLPSGMALLCLLIAPPCHALSTDTTAWFLSTTQALYDAVAPGDKGPWDRVLSPDCTITTEDGEVFDKAQFLKELRPLPAGSSGRIKVRGLTVRPLGTGAVVHYWLDEVEDIFDQELHTTYVETDTYERTHEGGQASWKMVAAQVTVVPRDLTPIAVNSQGWRALVGVYKYSDKAASQYQVFVRDGALFGGRDTKSATRLIPLAPLVFYQQGSIHIMVFVQDRDGAVNEVRELHKYNEVRMRRFSGPG